MPEPDNLVLSILREVRVEIGEFRRSVDQRFDAVDQRFDHVEQRLDSLETKTDGLAILLASTFGHLSHEMHVLTARVDEFATSKA
jgi:hypothetical protein